MPRSSPTIQGVNPAVRGTPPSKLLTRLRVICLELPEVREERAWAILDDRTDWDEIELLVKVSYRVLAPEKLAAMVE